MKYSALIVAALLLVACRHERVTSDWVYTPSPAVDCKVPAGQVVVQGSYQGKNLYVQNPYTNCTDTTIKFCTASVTINDSITIPKDSTASTAFGIPLTSYGFKIGDPITIVITHYSDCKPKILNPEVR